MLYTPHYILWNFWCNPSIIWYNTSFDIYIYIQTVYLWTNVFKYKYTFLTKNQCYYIKIIQPKYSNKTNTLDSNNTFQIWQKKGISLTLKVTPFFGILYSFLINPHIRKYLQNNILTIILKKAGENNRLGIRIRKKNLKNATSAVIYIYISLLCHVILHAIYYRLSAP